jgi:hypothetical protein
MCPPGFVMYLQAHVLLAGQPADWMLMMRTWIEGAQQRASAEFLNVRC